MKFWYYYINQLVSRIFDYIERWSIVAYFNNTKIIYSPLRYSIYKRVYYRLICLFTGRIQYNSWLKKFDRRDSTTSILVKNWIKNLPGLPLISLVLFLEKQDVKTIPEYLDNLDSQIYKNWELLLITREENIDALKESLSWRSDYGFIKLLNSKFVPFHDISKVLHHVRGAMVTFTDINARYPFHALALIAYTLSNTDNCSFIYGDHDYTNTKNERFDPEFKSDWNDVLFRSIDYIKYPVFYDTTRLRNIIINANKEIRVNQTFVIRSLLKCENNINVEHIPHIIYHHYKKDELNNSDETNKRDKHWFCDNYAGDMCHENNVVIDDELKSVCIVIPTRNGFDLLSRCVNGLLYETNYKNMEVIIINNDSDDIKTREYLRYLNTLDAVNVYDYNDRFNYSAINNYAISKTHADYVCLMNNDIEIIHNDWLKNMVYYMKEDDVGVVGAKLLYPDNRIQHAGVILGLRGGVAGHAFRYFPSDSCGYLDKLLYPAEVSCVTAACLLTKRTIYQQVDGLDSKNLTVAYNDVDYCLKVKKAGYKIIWTPGAKLYHHESASRGFDVSHENYDRWSSEYHYMRQKWGDSLEIDPYYNSNLSNEHEDYSLSNPPRVPYPWSDINNPEIRVINT